MDGKENEVEEVKSEVVGLENKNNAGVLGIISLVLGILSILCCWLPFFNFVFGIMAIVLGAIELKNIKRGVTGSNGRVMAIIGIALGSIIILFFIISLFTFGLNAILQLPQLNRNWY